MIDNPTQKAIETIKVTIRGTEAYRLGVLEAEKIIIDTLNESHYAFWWCEEVMKEVKERLKSLKHQLDFIELVEKT